MKMIHSLMCESNPQLSQVQYKILLSIYILNFYLKNNFALQKLFFIFIPIREARENGQTNATISAYVFCHNAVNVHELGGFSCFSIHNFKYMCLSILACYDLHSIMKMLHNIQILHVYSC